MVQAEHELRRETAERLVLWVGISALVRVITGLVFAFRLRSMRAATA